MADALQGTWVFNESIGFLNSNSSAYINFNSNGTTFSRLDYVRRLSPKIEYATDYGDRLTVFESPDWLDSAYREIQITPFSTDYVGTGDFSDVDAFLTWLQSNATKLPDTPTYTYTVKSYDGASELATVSAPSITAAQFTDGTLTLTDADGSTHIASWTSAVPEGMKLLGLAYTQGATSADIPIGEAISVLWEADTVLYEVYAPIVATVTYNGSVIAELNGGEMKKLLTGGKYLEGDLTVEAAEVIDSPLPIEVSTETEMTALLESGEVGGVYKYTGTTGTYENGALYVLEASE